MTSSPDSQTSSLPAAALQRSYRSPRTLFSMAMTGVTFLMAASALIPLVAVISYVIINGGKRLGFDLFTKLPPSPIETAGGGFGNAILGTLLTVGIGAAISIPFGILAAIYLSEFGRDTWLASAIDFFTNVLSGVPSIVVGVFAYGIVVAKSGFSLKLGISAIAGGAALAVLMLPVIVRTSAEALEAVSPDLRQAALGLGATNFQTVSRVVLPAAIAPITTGIMLAVSRAAGETAPLIFTVLFSQFWIRSLQEPTATLSVLVYNFAGAPSDNQKELAWAASLVLVVLVLTTSVLARLFTRRPSR